MSGGSLVLWKGHGLEAVKEGVVVEAVELLARVVLKLEAVKGIYM